MIEAQIPANEQDRLSAIRRYRLSGLGKEPEFNRVAQLAAALFDMPTTLVSIVGADEQCMRGSFGFEPESTPRSIAFCAHAILSEAVMIVPDATADPRFMANPLVTGDPGIRFYAGAPLMVDGVSVGTLCLIDYQPRSFGEVQAGQMAKLATTLVDLITLRVDHLMLGDETLLMRTAIEGIEQGLAVFDPDLHLVHWNSAFFGMFCSADCVVRNGVGATELLQMTMERSSPGQTDTAVRVSAFIASVHSEKHDRLEVQLNDGRDIQIWPNTLPDGRLILTATDISAQRRLERTKDEFVSTVSHELRTPLTSIVGSLGLLARGVGGELPPKVVQLVNIALSNGQRLTRLINDLLDINKLESGQSNFSFAPIDIEQVVQAALDQNQPYAERFGVELQMVGASEKLVVSGDHDRLLQVLANLLSNAIKNSPAGAVVSVELSRRGTAANIAVVDRGAGIPAAFRSRMFNRFAQADSSDRRGQQGTGLGLAITHSIVERHGGKISFETEEGKGTVFNIEFDLQPEHASQKSPDNSGRLILFCSSDAPGALAGANYLREAGFLVDIASSAHEARAQLGQRQYSALLLDLIMSDAEGMKLVSELRASPLTQLLPVVILTPAGNDASSQWPALDLVDWLTGPIESKRFVPALRKLSIPERPTKARVLHVEDDHDVLKIVQLALCEVADIEHSTNLADARKRLETDIYDLVILDITLPDGSGLELLSILSATEPAVPVVIFSATEPDAETIQQVSCALTKTKSSVQQLAERVRSLIDRNQRNQA